MSKYYRTIVLLVLVALVAACGGMPGVKIARHPAPDNYSALNVYTELPVYDPNSTDLWQVDLRSSDLTKLDLSKSKEDLLYADFDSKTQWPTADKMPADFDWQKIMEINKDPGLNIRKLHEQGINGKGVSIAIIDQTLLTDHVEFKDQLRLYEEAEDIVGGSSSMHGPAVASIAVGKTVGVAPKANLYYIATSEWGNFSYTANIIRKVVEINKTLPVDRKIRALSISRGWMPDENGYDEIIAAINEAKADGIFVISVSLEQTYGWNFIGLGRNSIADPNNFQSYEPGLPWQERFYQNNFPATMLWVPMDSRTTASPTGTEDYVFYREGGMSWTVPYLAGMYALAAQVKPDITPDEFWDVALKTGRTIQLQHDGKEYEFGVILDPQALIAAIKDK